MQAELLKDGGKEMVSEFRDVILQISIMEEIPEDWTENICPIHKQGKLMECQNYRGISLLNTVYKVKVKLFLCLNN
jgi:hypothetical protein